MEKWLFAMLYAIVLYPMLINSTMDAKKHRNLTVTLVSLTEYQCAKLCATRAATNHQASLEMSRAPPMITAFTKTTIANKGKFSTQLACEHPTRPMKVLSVSFRMLVNAVGLARPVLMSTDRWTITMTT